VDLMAVVPAQYDVEAGRPLQQGQELGVLFAAVHTSHDPINHFRRGMSIALRVLLR
jgi:hypothetical protein